MKPSWFRGEHRFSSVLFTLKNDCIGAIKLFCKENEFLVVESKEKSFLGIPVRGNQTAEPSH